MNENQTEIGGRIISVGWLLPTEAIKVQVALASICGEALFKAVGKKEANSKEAVAAAISALTAKLDSEVLMTAIHKLYAVVTIDGKRPPFEEAFSQGRHKDMWQVVFFALRYNFKDFLPASLFKQIAAKLAMESSQSSSPTSTGTSGDQ